jgi:flagellar biosynthesis/type III secretory pathway M-ring protein FliF/YscJ
MDFVKLQAQKIKQQLAGLTPSQRMLAGALAVIMVMTLLWWSRYAATSEMEDLLAQDLSAEDVSRIGMLLDAHKIPRQLNGSRMQVPAERRIEAVGLITFEQIGPRDTSAGFDEIISKMDSPWNTDKKQEVMFNRAKEATLAQFMREWPGVRDARVVINNAARRAFGEASVAPSATVNLKMKNVGDKPGKKLIDAAANTLVGAVSGMTRSKVTVIVDGASYSVQDNDGGGAGSDTWMDIVKDHEHYFTQKILDHFNRIDGLMVSVTVDPKMQQSQIEKETYDKAKTFSKETQIDEKTDDSNTTSRAGAEPGINPNTGGANQPSSVGGGGGAGASGEGTTTNSTQNITKLQIFPSVVREWIRSPAGASVVVGASIGVPRSHFVRIFKAINPTAKDPDDTTLQPLVDAELIKIRDQVTGCISQTPLDKVKVDSYYDYLPASESLAQPALATSVPLAITNHLKEIALGALALVSLFMVSMMVRKAAPAPIIAPKPERATPNASLAAETIAAEASEGMQSMDGMEVDDDSVRTQQMIGQVSSMVKENPDGAASLVKRWLNRT